MKKKIDITNHILMAKHEKLGEAAANKILEKYNISKKQLPVIFVKDPAIKHLEAKSGDIIEITRKSPTTHTSNFWRVVIDG